MDKVLTGIVLFCAFITFTYSECWYKSRVQCSNVDTFPVKHAMSRDILISNSTITLCGQIWFKNTTLINANVSFWCQKPQTAVYKMTGTGGSTDIGDYSTFGLLGYLLFLVLLFPNIFYIMHNQKKTNTGIRALKTVNSV